MKTRLEEQIEKMQNELNTFISFSVEKHALFLLDLNNSIIPILTKYKTGVVGPCDNTFVDKGIMDETKLTYRVYLKVDLSKLSDLQKRNLEKALRAVNVPMPCCPISTNSISLVYHN